jgi:carboxymethylenebutenolidase
LIRQQLKFGIESRRSPGDNSPVRFLKSFIRRSALTIKTEWIRYGDQLGYLALPARAAQPLPGIVLIPDVWGVEDSHQDIVQRFAAAGYAVLAPDLYAVDGARPAAVQPARLEAVLEINRRLPSGALFNPALREAEIAKLAQPEQDRVRETLASVSLLLTKTNRFLGPLRQAVRHLRHERPETRGGKVACVGFCMGGGLAALLACEEPELSGAAVFYGNMPNAEKAANLHCPVIGFYGALDPRVNGTLPEFETAVQAASKSFEPHIYPDAGHGFFNPTRAAYEVNASRDAFARVLNFFSQTLTG